jgi:hypothetical protein
MKSYFNAQNCPFFFCPTVVFIISITVHQLKSYRKSDTLINYFKLTRVIKKGKFGMWISISSKNSTAIFTLRFNILSCRKFIRYEMKGKLNIASGCSLLTLRWETGNVRDIEQFYRPCFRSASITEFRYVAGDRLRHIFDPEVKSFKTSS